MTDLSDYDYDLPKELIAQRPLSQRIDARLMVVDRQANSITHAHVRDLPQLLREGDCLVLNDTRVIPAKLLGRRVATGGRWQGLFLEQDPEGNWLMLCKTRGKLHAGEDIMLLGQHGHEAATLRLLRRIEPDAWAARPLTSEPTHELLERIGRVPLPHYIRRGEALPSDRDDYQTVFADASGSVAAPTAGLHFTPALLEKVREAGVGVEKVTLHVGMGTFRPIKSDRLEQHLMHQEWCRLSAETAERLRRVRASDGRLIAVGTTTVRTLETAARDGQLQPWEGKTELFIHPPYEFRVIDALLTNFHLPKSTLLVLARTFGGDKLIKQAYAEAIRETYRFFSYGDAMLIL